MKPHYFSQEAADSDDWLLGMAKMQGYIPKSCLLGGEVVMLEIGEGRNPCWGCEGPRDKCHSQPKRIARQVSQSTQKDLTTNTNREKTL